MGKPTQLWKLCRSFGSQPVGNVGGPRWTKAGIVGQVIPSQSSRRTFREGQNPTADPPLLVVGDRWGSDLRNRSGQSSDIASTFKSKIETFASAEPPAHAKLSLARVTIQSSPPDPPPMIIYHLLSLFRFKTQQVLI